MSRARAIALAAAVLACLAGCAGPAGEGAADGSPAAPGPREGLTTNGLFLVSWEPVPDPIPFNEPFELVVRVRRAASPEGAAATAGPQAELQLELNAMMPAHGHGMNRTPRVTRRPDGAFRVEGMLFHMEGRWDLVAVVRQGRDFGQAILPVDVSVAAFTAPVFTAEERQRILSLSPLPPVPPDPTNRFADDPAAARLGQSLFFEARLSADGAVSCATCHLPQRAFTDGRPLGRGLTDLERHTPALWNLAYNRWFFWDGRSDTLWAQAIHPLTDPREMGGSPEAVLDLLREDERLRGDYEGLFGPLPPAGADERALDGVLVGVGKAIAAYERRLVSRDAPFDVFVEGLREDDPRKQAALSPAARRGLRTFVGRGGCHLCHSGPNFTDREFHSTRVPPLRPELGKDPGRQAGIERLLADRFNARSAFADDGGARAAGTLDFLSPGVENLGQFKTPSLRNVALTAPYMHQGQMATLRDVLHHYSTFDVVHDPLRNHFETMLQPLQLSESEVADLEAFLESLTGAGIDPDLLGPPPGA